MQQQDVMKEPGPDHPLTIEPSRQCVRAAFERHVIADTDDALVVREADYPPVYYFPMEDVDMEFMSQTQHATHCPYKGDASYFTIYRDGKLIENAVWSYEDPFPAVGQIGNRVAFYPEHVDFELGDLTAAETKAAFDVNEVVRHTDSGAGTSQAEHWPPNVDMPDPDRIERDVDQPYKGVGSL